MIDDFVLLPFASSPSSPPPPTSPRLPSAHPAPYQMRIVAQNDKWKWNKGYNTRTSPHPPPPLPPPPTHTHQMQIVARNDKWKWNKGFTKRTQKWIGTALERTEKRLWCSNMFEPDKGQAILSRYIQPNLINLPFALKFWLLKDKDKVCICHNSGFFAAKVHYWLMLICILCLHCKLVYVFMYRH